jgi:hypothetical protein
MGGTDRERPDIRPLAIWPICLYEVARHAPGAALISVYKPT